MKKMVLLSALAFAALFSNLGTGTVYAKQSVLPYAAYTDIDPQSDNYVWVYATKNGVPCRRLYDTKNQCWVGDWEPCP